MLPEVGLLLKVLVAGLLVVAVGLWFAVAFQSLLFQRYRLHKNEAALRKARLHEEDADERRYREQLLGSIRNEDSKKKE